jgi:pyruvate dehydrogenase E1 component alpha subunit
MAQPAGTTEDADLVRLLTPEGDRLTTGDYASLVADVGADGMRARYRDLVLCRRFDDEATALQRQGELGLWASMRGQEGAQIGSGRALRPQDHVFPTYREHAVAYLRGIPFEAILSLYRGCDYGAWRPADHGFSLYTLVIGAHSLHAAGFAMGVQRDGAVGTGDPERDTAVVAYVGDGALSQGDVNETLVFAASFQAPLVMFCQNNQWAISVPASRQSRIPLHRRADGFGVPGVRVDGNDVLAVEAVTRSALDRARSGGGPTLVEAYTYRMAAHTTSDDAGRYRPDHEREHWARLDPILRVRTWLEFEGAADPDWLAAVDSEADDLAADVRRRCRALPDPPEEWMFDHVYGAPHDPLDAERRAFRHYRDGTPDPAVLAALGGGPGGAP